MSFSLEPATVSPPSLEARPISALQIVSDGAELEGQKLALNLKLGRPSIWLSALRQAKGFTPKRKDTNLRASTGCAKVTND